MTPSYQGTVKTLEGRAALQKAPISFKNGLIETLDCSTKTNVKFCTWVRITSYNTNRLGNDWLGSSFAGKGLGVLVVKLSVRKQCPFVIMKVNYTTVLQSAEQKKWLISSPCYLEAGLGVLCTILGPPAQKRLPNWSKYNRQPLSWLRAWNMLRTRQVWSNRLFKTDGKKTKGESNSCQQLPREGKLQSSSQ